MATLTRPPKKVEIVSSGNVICGVCLCVTRICMILFVICAGKELNDPRVLTDVGDVPVQDIRDCGVDDDRLMNVISESVKLSHFLSLLCTGDMDQQIWRIFSSLAWFHCINKKK